MINTSAVPRCLLPIAIGFAPWLLSLIVGEPAAASERFVRGDADASGQLDVVDAIRVLELLFLDQHEAVPCLDAADADDSGKIDVTDAVRILVGLFQRRPPPPAPFPGCGHDLTRDDLACGSYTVCSPFHDLFGIEIEGGGVFFVIDRSGTMQDAGEFALAKKEAEEVISAFPDGIEFGVIFTASFFVKFPLGEEPAVASEETRRSGASFVRGTQGGSGSCDRPALIAALNYARHASARRSVVLYMTDGHGTCNTDDVQSEAKYLQETITAVTAANQGIARIHSLQIGPTGSIQEKFLRDLASQNGGEYHEIPLR